MAVPSALRHLSLVDAYAEMLFDLDPRDRAAREWISRDHTQMGNPPGKKYDDPTVRLGSARLITHYWPAVEVQCLDLGEQPAAAVR